MIGVGPGENHKASFSEIKGRDVAFSTVSAVRDTAPGRYEYSVEAE